ncbi:hypothetical protein KKF84_03640 [Myxococcota bacterium]|nr:hypothetical protein [Myxococcota bacterium]
MINIINDLDPQNSVNYKNTVALIQTALEQMRKGVSKPFPLLLSTNQMMVMAIFSALERVFHDELDPEQSMVIAVIWGLIELLKERLHSHAKLATRFDKQRKLHNHKWINFAQSIESQVSHLSQCHPFLDDGKLFAMMLKGYVDLRDHLKEADLLRWPCRPEEHCPVCTGEVKHGC